MLSMRSRSNRRSRLAGRLLSIQSRTSVSMGIGFRGRNSGAGNDSRPAVARKGGLWHQAAGLHRRRRHHGRNHRADQPRRAGSTPEVARRATGIIVNFLAHRGAGRMRSTRCSTTCREAAIWRRRPAAASGGLHGRLRRVDRRRPRHGRHPGRRQRAARLGSRQGGAGEGRRGDRRGSPASPVHLS